MGTHSADGAVDTGRAAYPAYTCMLLSTQLKCIGNSPTGLECMGKSPMGRMETGQATGLLTFRVQAGYKRARAERGTPREQQQQASTALEEIAPFGSVFINEERA